MGSKTNNSQQVLDLLIIGAGMAGINLAHHVAKHFPNWDWEVHDSNEQIGGTWHTFTYPGIRSDSDMATFGLPYFPWSKENTLGSGAEIKEYMTAAATSSGITSHLRLSSKVLRLNWSSERQLYEVTIQNLTTGSQSIRLVRRVHCATGYFHHDHGYQPHFPNQESFTGQVIHPQNWPEHLDCAGKKFVIIGSGATAVTLVPALTDRGAHVTMLQRTPTYIVSLPARDNISALWKRLVPQRRIASILSRATHSLRDESQYLVARIVPGLFIWFVRSSQRAYLPDEVIRQHFTPPYKPWAQRVCKAPNGDFFQAINAGASVVTDTIEAFTPQGVRLASGTELPADYIVSATGLELRFFGGIPLSIDGHQVDPAARLSYRGLMLAGIPNLSFSVGYFNASWTLRTDLVARYLMRLWRKAANQTYVPVPSEDEPADQDFFTLDSGYVKRGVHRFPRLSSRRGPWRYKQNYPLEWLTVGHGNVGTDMAFGAQARDYVAGGLAQSCELAAGDAGDLVDAGDAGEALGTMDAVNTLKR